MISIFKILFALGLGFYALWGGFVPKVAWLLDGANLLFHEAGHPLFGILGQWMGMAGGTLMQLLIPGGLAAAFFYKRQFYSAGIMSLWFGQNLFGISVYIRDARALNLPLVGGGDHDWNYLLHHAGLLNHDQGLGKLVWLCGFIIIIAAMWFSICQVKKDTV